MSNFVEKLRLKEMAEEDLYFAKQDLDLIKALHNKKLAKAADCSSEKCNAKAEGFEKRFERIKDKHKKKPRKLFRALSALVEDVKKTFRDLE